MGETSRLGQLDRLGREVKTLISVELVAKVEEETSRLTRETTSGSGGKMRRDEEVGDVGCIYLAGDRSMVAGRAFVAEHGHVVWGNPKEAEDGGVERGIGGSKVAHRQMVFGDGANFGDVEFGVGGVADGENGAWV